MTQQRTYTPQEMADIVSHLDKQAGRPERMPAGDVAARAGLLGVGAMFVTGGAAWLMQMPWEYAAQVCGLSFMFTAGAAIWWVMPTDKRETAARFRRMMQTCELYRAQKVAAYKAIQELEVKNTELQQALNRALKEREIALLEKSHALNEAQSANNQNFVRASNTAAHADAQEMLKYWFESGGERWFSRATANAQSWPDKRHKAAQQLLVDSGVLVINEKRPKILVDSFAVALQQLGDYVERVNSVNVPSERSNAWGDDDGD